MRKPEERFITYCGFESPRDFNEIEFELLGLQNLIKRAEERISMLKQSSFLANLAINNESEGLDKYFEEESDDTSNSFE
jgi:hypothetical protein|tara:strand:+ start:830 stop:1066 length:237 start_codon:yes stop_codon:yes gene_type:complete